MDAEIGAEADGCTEEGRAMRGLVGDPLSPEYLLRAGLQVTAPQPAEGGTAALLSVRKNTV